MKNQIDALKKGDEILILAPAKAIDVNCVLFAKTLLEKEGYRVSISKNCTNRYHYFSGTEAERLLDFQEAIDNPSIKAVLCARGGYGCVQIVDKIQWASFLRHPKWIIGFSDITVLHQRIQNLELPSIHGTMPLNFSSNSRETFSTLFKSLRKEPYQIQSKYNANNKLGKATGKLIGGNLSIVYSLLGTNDQVNFEGALLFIEDVDEQLYSIDRMFYALNKAGVLDQISGLIVGGMTGLKDTNPPIGMSLEEIVVSHFQYKKTPVCFGFPAGHLDDNRALVFGEEIDFHVDATGSSVAFYSNEII